MVESTSKAAGKQGQCPSLPDGAALCHGMHAAAADTDSKSIARNATKPSKRRLPKMGRHSSGQARVRLNGKPHYLGLWGSPEAHEAYGKLLKQWEATDRKPIGPQPVHADEATFTMGDLAEQYEAWLDGTGRYRKHGKETSARRVTRVALRRLGEFAGAVLVRRVSEALLLQWRDRLETANPKWARSTVNRYVHRVLLMLNWGRARGLVPKPVWADVSMLEPLKRTDCPGRPEHGRARRAVSIEDVEEVAKHCCNQIAAMMRLQLLTAMRPGEVCALRWADIDKNGPDGKWVYTVVAPKTEHHGHVTRYLLGPRAQAILEQFPAVPRAYVFSPAKRMADRRAAGQQRPLAPGPRRTFNAKWHPVAYRLHVVLACEAAKVQLFTPHELRHSAITRVVEVVGLTAASAVANHRSLAMTSRYYHRDDGEALRAVVALDQIG